MEPCGFIPLVFDSTGSGVASLVFVEFRSSTDFTIRPAQTRRIDIHAFEPLRP